jgi:hypothetical protein
MAEYTISKSYSRKVSRDYQSWDFFTALSHTVNVETKEELLAENTKLFKQAKALTDLDIESVKHEWGE